MRYLKVVTARVHVVLFYLLFYLPLTVMGPPFYVLIRATLVHREELILESHTIFGAGLDDFGLEVVTLRTLGRRN